MLQEYPWDILTYEVLVKKNLTLKHYYTDN